MPGLYYSDEKHMAEWLTLSRTDTGIQDYMEKYVFKAPTHKDYINLIGGKEKMEYLGKLERLEVPLNAPWARRT
jgi:hypothetical protein